MNPLCRALAFSSTLLGAACASDPAATAPGGAGGDSSMSGTSGTAGSSSGSAALGCPEGPAQNDAPQPLTVGTVTAQFVDEQGEPALVGRIQICGVDICRDATPSTSKSGKLVKVMNEPVDAPACKFGDGQEWAELLVPIAEGDNDLGTLTSARLPDYAGAPRFEPGKSVSSNGLTLTLSPRAHIEPNTLDYETEAEQQSLRAVELTPPALAQLQLDFVSGFGISPIGTVICPSPAVTLTNSSKLPAGTELELYILGLDAAGHWAAYGRWQKVGDGKVSDDGETLEFPAGVPVLSALAVRVKP